MTRKLKLKVYLALGLLLVTGLLYAIPAYIDRWFFIDLGWPFNGHWLMTLHGLGAFIFIYLFGYLYRCHVMVQKRTHRRIRSGWSMVSMLLLLVGSGYLLYYLGDEDWRLLAGDIHCLLGVVLPVGLVIHRYASLARRESVTAELGDSPVKGV